MRDKTSNSWMRKQVLGKTTVEVVELKNFRCVVPFVLASISSSSGSCSYLNCTRPSISGCFFRDDHKQVESSATGNTSEQSETFLTMLAAEHQGRFT